MLCFKLENGNISCYLSFNITELTYVIIVKIIENLTRISIEIDWNDFL